MSKKPNRNPLPGFLLLTLCLLTLMVCGLAFALFWNIDRYSVSLETDVPENITVNYGEAYAIPDVTASLEGPLLPKDGIPVPVAREGEVDTGTLGSYEVVYSVSVLGVYHQTYRSRIDVIDMTAPELSLKGETEISLKEGETYTEPGYTAEDQHDGDLTDKVSISGAPDVQTPGAYTLVYTVTDASGNKTTQERIVKVNDATPPEITLKGDAELHIIQGHTFEDPGCTAVDSVDGELEVTAEDLPDTETVGEYTITYRAVDSAGNESTAERKVIVQAPAPDPVDPGDKVVYLSFDDGPGQYTQQLLDVLDKYNVKVTFFVTNQFPGYQSMIAKEAAAGHTVAVHTYTHDFSQIYTSVDDYFDDFQKMSDIVEEQTGVTPKILRFPGGTSNTVSKKYCTGIMTALTQECDNRGLYYCDWNVDSNDAGGASTAEEVAANVINGLKNTNVSYVLQHDIKKFSVDAVEEIVKWGLENGYTFLPMTTASPMRHHSLNN